MRKFKSTQDVKKLQKLALAIVALTIIVWVISLAMDPKLYLNDVPSDKTLEPLLEKHALIPAVSSFSSLSVPLTTTKRAMGYKISVTKNQIIIELTGLRYQCNPLTRFGVPVGIDGGWEVCMNYFPYVDAKTPNPAFYTRGDMLPNCVIYSFGVSVKPSFDFDISKSFPLCTLHAFDPNQHSVDMMASLLTAGSLPANFQFHPYGVSNMDGIALLDGHLKLPVKRLPTIMQDLGHSKIDILKIDIEGSEYALFRDIIESKSGVLKNVRQLLIEFHWWPGYTDGKTSAETAAEIAFVLDALAANGFVPFHDQPRRAGDQSQEFWFVRVTE